MSKALTFLTLTIASSIPMTISCATVISGTSQAVTIDCNVPGASVSIEGNNVGVTPFSSKIKRQKEAIATVSMDGYITQTIPLTTSYNPVATLSIFWDLSTTDFLTGAAWEYAPNSYFVNLKARGAEELSFRQESSAKAFAMTYFGDLQMELINGDGPLLRSLREQFFTSTSPDLLIEMLRPLDQSNAVSFGEAVGALLSV